MAYKNTTKFLAILAIFTLVATVVPTYTQAQSTDTGQEWGNTGKTYTLLEPLPCLDPSQPDCDGGQIKEIDLGNFFQYAFNLLIALSAVAAVFMMVWGGFLYTTTASSTQKSEGLDKFTNAVWGLLFVLAAFLIMRTVNPQLVEIPTSVPAVTVPESLKVSPSDLLTRINDDVQSALIEAHSSQVDGLAEIIQNSKKKIDDLTEQWNEIQNEIEFGKLSEEEIAIAKDEQLIIELQAAEENANLVVSRTKGRIANTWHSATSGGTSQKYIADARAKIDEEYKRGISDLEKALENPINQKKELDNIKSFSNTVLDVQSALIDFGENSSGSSVSSKIEVVAHNFAGTVTEAILAPGFLIGRTLSGGSSKVSEVLDKATQARLYNKLTTTANESIKKYQITDENLKKQLQNIVDSIVKNPNQTI